MASIIRKVTSVDSYIRALPSDHAVLALAARELLLDLHPDMKVTLKWQIPYYSCNGLLCGFVYYASTEQSGLLFARGPELSNDYGLLLAHSPGTPNRALTGTRLLLISNEAQLTSEVVLASLHEAIQLNRQKANKS